MPGSVTAAAAFALNDQPGVSAAIRARSLAIASELGFQPSAARALPDGRAGAVGLGATRAGLAIAGWQTAAERPPPAVSAVVSAHLPDHVAAGNAGHPAAAVSG